MHSVILCGGSGARLWPLSRNNYPKQFLSLGSDLSLLQDTYMRMRDVMSAKNIYFVTNEPNFYHVYNQIRDVDGSFDRAQVLIEPTSRSTAPAIALAVKHIMDKDGADATEPIIVLPADHVINGRDAFISTVQEAMNSISGQIGTIGITPNKPVTSYGYIRRHESSGSSAKVAEFKEKPDTVTAQKYIDSGDYLWNSGIYLFNSQTFASELRKHAPKIFEQMAKSFDDFMSNFADMPSISIDYAISEKSDNMIVFEGRFGWSDVGTFDSIADLSEDMSSLKTRHININSKNVFVHSTNDRLVATCGVEDLVIIDNADSILVHKRGQGEGVRQVVEHLKEKGYKELNHSTVVHKPWGKYEVLTDRRDHKVKRILIYPGEKLSLQSHHHRAEHWIVIRGIARITNGDKELLLRENESTFIPSTVTHRLENPGKINLEIIEAQTGNYLEEDDIIRYEDIYARK